MSVKIILLTPKSLTSLRKSIVLILRFSFQPETERFPSFASKPKAIWFLNLSQAILKNSLSLIAPLPRITFSTPESI